MTTTIDHGVATSGSPEVAPIGPLADLVARPALEAAGADIDGARHQLIEMIVSTTPSVHLQPIVHIQSGGHVGDEALARFPGSTPAAEWFRTAHALGVGDDLELRMLAEVLRQLDRRSGFIGVNISPVVLLDPRCLELLRTVGDAELVVEITDQTVLPKMSLLRARLEEIRDLGVRTAVHVAAFGVETTQLLMLAQPDVVKLDPPLTAAIAAGHTASTAADNFFRYCRHEGVFTVAVGVETRDQLVALHEAGVDASQGYVFAGLA